MKYYLKLSLLFVLLFIFSSTVADSDHNRAKILLEAGKIKPLQQVLKKAQQLHQGKILEVELETKNGQLVYEIELLIANGQVVELLFDAKTAQHISTKRED